jgi:TldD protein
LKTGGMAVGAATLPAWLLEAEAEEAAAINHDALADAALATAQKLGADYADIRIIRRREEGIYTREDRVQWVERRQTFGFGVRVLVAGAWGFAGSNTVTEKEVRAIVAAAAEVAAANAKYIRRPIELLPAKGVKDTWKSAFKKDPLDVSMGEKIDRLLAINRAALGVKGVSFVNSSMNWVNEQRYLATTDGTRIDQYLIRGYPAFEVTAVDRQTGDFQTRASLSGPRAAGFEYMDDHDWLGEAGEAGEQALAKLSAKPVAPAAYDLVIDPSNLWLTIHESVGHSTELDRALWWEADYAGTSFLTPKETGKLRFGSDIVNFVADRTQPTGLATVGYDDEGVPGQSWYLVKDGIFVDWQTTRDLAPLIGRKTSYGCLSSQSWEFTSFPRMPNVSLQPGKDDIGREELAAEVKNGILIVGNGSWSIDQQRYNFQFGGQLFYEIRNGKVGAMLRDVAYQARTTDFWGSCDGIGGAASYAINGAFNDGKGEPSQISTVSHGCPVSRFRGITVLNSAA